MVLFYSPESLLMYTDEENDWDDAILIRLQSTAPLSDKFLAVARATCRKTKWIQIGTVGQPPGLGLAFLKTGLGAAPSKIVSVVGFQCLPIALFAWGCKWFEALFVWDSTWPLCDPTVLWYSGVGGVVDMYHPHWGEMYPLLLALGWALWAIILFADFLPTAPTTVPAPFFITIDPPIDGIQLCLLACRCCGKALLLRIADFMGLRCFSCFDWFAVVLGILPGDVLWGLLLDCGDEDEDVDAE